MSLPELTYNRTPRTSRLGEIVKTIMETQIKPIQTRMDLVREAWSRIVPPGLLSHCRIQEVKGSILKVSVESSAYRYELQLCSQALLKELQFQVPQAQLRSIKLIIGSIR